MRLLWQKATKTGPHSTDHSERLQNIYFNYAFWWTLNLCYHPGWDKFSLNTLWENIWAPAKQIPFTNAFFLHTNGLIDNNLFDRAFTY